jgi:hypothetical protein
MLLRYRDDFKLHCKTLWPWRDSCSVRQILISGPVIHLSGWVSFGRSLIPQGWGRPKITFRQNSNLVSKFILHRHCKSDIYAVTKLHTCKFLTVAGGSTFHKICYFVRKGKGTNLSLCPSNTSLRRRGKSQPFYRVIRWGWVVSFTFQLLYSRENRPWRWRQYASPKRWYLPTSPHCVTTQKNNIDIFTAVRTSSIT